MSVQKNNTYGELVIPWVKQLTIFFLILFLKLYAQDEEYITFVMPADADPRDLVFIEVTGFHPGAQRYFVASNTKQGKSILKESKKLKDALARTSRINIAPMQAVSSEGSPQERIGRAMHQLKINVSKLEASQQNFRHKLESTQQDSHYKNLLYTGYAAILATGIGFFIGRYYSHPGTFHSDMQSIHSLLLPQKSPLRA